MTLEPPSETGRTRLVGFAHPSSITDDARNLWRFVHVFWKKNVEAPNSCVYTVAGSRKCKWKDQLTRCENGRRTDSVPVTTVDARSSKSNARCVSANRSGENTTAAAAGRENDMCRVRARSREPSAQRSAQRTPTLQTLHAPRLITRIITICVHTCTRRIRPLSGRLCPDAPERPTT